MAEFSVILADLRAKADELEALNQQFNTEVQNLQETEGALQGMWEGDANTAFHTVFSEDVGKMNSFYSAISQYVQVLRTIADNYQNAEAQNVDIATERHY